MAGEEVKVDVKLLELVRWCGPIPIRPVAAHSDERTGHGSHPTRPDPRALFTPGVDFETDLTCTLALSLKGSTES